MIRETQSEITIEIACSKRKLFQILHSKGFFFKERFFITDHYFTHLNTTAQTVDFKTLSKNSFLIRNVEIERKFLLDAQGITSLLYKKKEIDDNDRSQSETKIVCRLQDNANKARRIFSEMGLNNWCVKKIIGYEFKCGSQLLVLQEVEGLGLFMEIEQFESQRGSPKKIISELIQFVMDLGIPTKSNDFHVNIAYRMYLETRKPKPKPKPKLAPKPAPKTTSKPKPKPKNPPKKPTPKKPPSK